MVTKGIMLGHKVSKLDLEVDKVKIKVVDKLSPPMNVKTSRIFLGHAGFYRQFVKYFSKIVHPLSMLLEVNRPFEFEHNCLKAFETLNQALVTTPILITPNWSIPFELMCDTSDNRMVLALVQRKEKILHPIAYATKTSNNA
ncbi:uncharacterized mitochondrial protein AtMg00860-like [Benincasa hispida]|uniref:uncharacterized mitochondrial protein AtMg00860-like n=1 Tax=Benincasa hispida TaxID=102211 RepID=UPI00190073D5|nr:uncharacterized mitochondrial protein AtMg00860-like [Benincasa hispida]